MKTALAFALLVFSVGTSPAADESKSDKDAIAILKKVIEAHGGLENCKKFAAVIFEHEVTKFKDDGEIEKLRVVCERHDSCKRVDVYGHDDRTKYTRTVVTELDAWSFDESGILINFLEDEKRLAINLIKCHSLIILAKIHKSKTIVALNVKQEKVDGIEYVKFTLTDPEIKGSTTLLIDIKTNLIRSASVRTGEYSQDILYLEYAKSQGVQVAKRELVYVNTRKSFEMNMKNIDFVDRPDPKMFTNPNPKIEVVK
jgi:hypothetical protein